MPDTNTYEIDESVVLEALQRDARDRNVRYSTHGASRKPNLRFLNSVIQDTNAHNAALKLRELESAGDRLRALRGDAPRERRAGERHPGKRREPRSGRRSGSESYDDYDDNGDEDNSGETTGGSLKRRRRRRSQRRDSTSSDETSSRSDYYCYTRDRDGRRRRKHDAHDRHDGLRPRHSKHRHPERRRMGYYSDDDRNIPRDGTRYKRHRDDHHHSDQRRHRDRLDRHGDDSTDSTRRMRKRRGSRSRSRSRSPRKGQYRRRQLEHETRNRDDRESQSSEEEEERRRKHNRRRQQRRHDDDSPRRRSPTTRSRSPGELTAATTESNPLPQQQHEQAERSRSPTNVVARDTLPLIAATGAHRRSPTRSPSIGPPPPGDPNLLGLQVRSPLPPPVIKRGRGAHSSAFVGSAMDRRFAADSYDDAQKDVLQQQQQQQQQQQPLDKSALSLNNINNNDYDDDWAGSLGAMRARADWRETQRKRLLAAGFSEENVGRWEKGGEDGLMRDEDSVKWNGKGERREWDRGKVITPGGDVETEIDWPKPS